MHDQSVAPQPGTKEAIQPVEPAEELGCILFDRDGVVIYSDDFVNTAEQVKLVPGAPEAIEKARAAGRPTGMCTNQNGLGEDLDGNVVWKNHPLSWQALNEIHAEMNRQLGEKAKFDVIVICPHAKSIDCECRKPKKAMPVKAARLLGIKRITKKCYMIGDRASDVESGLAAGMTAILVLTGPEGADSSEKAKVPEGTPIFPSIVEAIDWILAQDKKEQS